MRGFATSPNPYLTGNRAKSFFGIRHDMLKKEMRLGKTSKNVDAKVETLISTELKKAA